MPPRSGSVRARLALARAVLDSHYSQPATAIWRTFETEIVLDRLRASGRALDLGCGDGTLAGLLFSRVEDVRWTGLDIDAADARLAESRGLYERVHTASATAIPEPDECFDLVFSNSVLEHLPPLEDVVDEVWRVLRPGGRLIFTVPSADFRSALFWPRPLRLLGGEGLSAKYIAALDRRVAHVNYLSLEGWDDLLSRHGFRVMVSVPYLSQRTIGIWETVANATGGLATILTGGRMRPREVLQKAGSAGRSNRFLGTVAFVAMLPLVLAAAIERRPAHLGCLYVEAEKRS